MCVSSGAFHEQWDISGRPCSALNIRVWWGVAKPRCLGCLATVLMQQNRREKAGQHPGSTHQAYSDKVRTSVARMTPGAAG
jgi:hypothetical protein